MKFIDIVGQDQSEKEQILAAMRNIVERGDFILGEEVNSLEQDLERYLEAKHAILVSSGTDALLLALLSLDLPPESEVITTPFSFFATTEAIINAGLRPVYADINPTTHNIDVSQIESHINPKTRAILPVHLFGQPADMEAIMSLANQYNLSVIEDCAQAFGADLKEQSVGTFGDFGCFSFYPTKNLGAYGDAGLITTNDNRFAQRVRNLRNQGATLPYRHERVGFNSRCDTLQAAVLKTKLPKVEGLNLRRAYLAALYRRALNDTMEVTCPPVDQSVKHVYHQFTIELPRRDAVQNLLQQRHIPTAVYYRHPLHLQRAVKHLGYQEGDMPNAELASKRVLSLPIHPGLTESDIDEVAQTIRESIQTIK